MVVVLLIILYTLTFIVLLNRITKHSQNRLTKKEIALAFSFKVLMGISYGYVFKEFYGGDDTWLYFNESLNEYNKLLFQPGQFFKEIIPLSSLFQYPDFAIGFKDFLDKLEYNAVAKCLAFFNLVSLQNYYVDVVFFNIFSFFGSYLLFKLFANTWKERRLLIYIAAFFIPPITFWLSGIRSDALLLLSIALSLYYFHAWIRSKRWDHFLLFLVGLIGTFIFRIQFFMVIIPFLLAWAIAKQYPAKMKPWVIFASVFILSLLLFFGTSFLNQALSLPLMVAQKQHEFLGLKGNTVFQLNRLEPNAGSFLATFPQAAVNTFLRPYPWEAKGPLQWAASLEIIFFWIVVAAGLWNFKRISSVSLTWFVLFFGLCTYVLIGYTVPFPGAIVRYKIIPELLFILVFLPLLPFKLKKISI